MTETTADLVRRIEEVAGPWLDDYDEIETLSDGESVCTQLDHGNDHYEREIAVIRLLRDIIREGGGA